MIPESLKLNVSVCLLSYVSPVTAPINHSNIALSDSHN
jgi:hypothetical protein